jgi:hypothetical protein
MNVRAAWLSWLLLACGGGEQESPVPEEPEKCTEPVAEDAIAGAIAIGIGEPADFRAFAAGETFELVQGPQGGWMVTPTIRVDAELFGTNGTCAYLDVAAELESIVAPPLHLRVPDSSPGERYWYFWGIPLFLSFDVKALPGLTCTLSATFFDDGRHSSESVSGWLGEEP